MVHSIGLLIIMLILMPYVKLIPMASLAAVLVMVSYNMGEWEEFKTILKAPKSDAVVFIVTFLLTVFLDLVVAIGVGMVLASFLFMRRMADVTKVRNIMPEDEDANEVIENIKMPEHVSIYEINGPFFFGAAAEFAATVKNMGVPTKILILKMGKVPVMDATAYHAFEMLYDVCKHHHTELIILNIQEQPLNVLKKYGFAEILGMENFCNTVSEAIERANVIIEQHSYEIDKHHVVHTA
jgi:SulP family sulfate permease